MNWRTERMNLQVPRARQRAGSQSGRSRWVAHVRSKKRSLRETKRFYACAKHGLSSPAPHR